MEKKLTGKFIVTSNDNESKSITIRLPLKLLMEIEDLAEMSERSRNDIITKALRYAMDNCEYKPDGEHSIDAIGLCLDRDEPFADG